MEAMSSDLSPIWDVKTADLDDMATTYKTSGYLILDFGIEDDLVEQCAQITRSFLGKYSRVQDGYRNHPAFRALGCHASILRLLKHLYGRQAVPFQTLNFPEGTQQGTHADTIFFDSKPAGYMCGLWFALEDITEDCGPLHYYPTSHNRDVVTQAMIDKSHAGDLYARFKDEKTGYEKKLALLKKGQAILWSSNLLHGGEAIHVAGTTRLSQVNHYYFENCVYTAPTLKDGQGKPVTRLPYNILHNRFAWSHDEATNRRVWPHWKQWVVAMRDAVFRRSKMYKLDKPY